MQVITTITAHENSRLNNQWLGQQAGSTNAQCQCPAQMFTCERKDWCARLSLAIIDLNVLVW